MWRARPDGAIADEDAGCCPSPYGTGSTGRSVTVPIASVAAVRGSGPWQRSVAVARGGHKLRAWGPCASKRRRASCQAIRCRSTERWASGPVFRPEACQTRTLPAARCRGAIERRAPLARQPSSMAGTASARADRWATALDAMQCPCPGSAIAQAARCASGGSTARDQKGLEAEDGDAAKDREACRHAPLRMKSGSIPAGAWIACACRPTPAPSEKLAAGFQRLKASWPASSHAAKPRFAWLDPSLSTPTLRLASSLPR